jgi:hypothetical protein
VTSLLFSKDNASHFILKRHEKRKRGREREREGEGEKERENVCAITVNAGTERQRLPENRQRFTLYSLIGTLRSGYVFFVVWDRFKCKKKGSSHSSRRSFSFPIHAHFDFLYHAYILCIVANKETGTT